MGSNIGRYVGSTLIAVVLMSLAGAWAGYGIAQEERWYVDEEGLEWWVCRDEDGFLVRWLPDGARQAWGLGYNWRDIEEAYDLVRETRRRNGAGACG